MRISEIKAYPVWYGHRNLCLVKVETDEGVYGWGESGVSGRELAVVGAVKHFREFLVGKDPRNIGALWQEMYRGQYFEGGRILTGAISAIDIALWDIAGKLLNVPVCRLLGGSQRERIPCFITTTKPFDQSLVADCKELREAGWDVIRLTAGELGHSAHATELDVRQSVASAAAILTEVRQGLGHGVVLGIDFHHRLSVAEAASFCHKLAPGCLDFLEEPIRQQTPSAYRALRDMVDIPFAIGEECASKWDFLSYIESGLTNFARIDICNVGGFTEAVKIAAAAESHYIDVMPHDPLGPICSAATIQLSAAIPNLAWCEVSPYESRIPAEQDQLFLTPPVEDNCSYPISVTPGIGVDVVEEVAKEQAFKFWEAPRMTKPDGSFTNW